MMDSVLAGSDVTLATGFLAARATGVITRTHILFTHLSPTQFSSHSVLPESSLQLCNPAKGHKLNPFSTWLSGDVTHFPSIILAGSEEDMGEERQWRGTRRARLQSCHVRIIPVRLGEAKGTRRTKLQSPPVITCRVSVVPSMRLCTVAPVRPTRGGAWSWSILPSVRRCSVTAIGSPGSLCCSGIRSWGMLPVGVMTSPVRDICWWGSPSRVALWRWTPYLHHCDYLYINFIWFAQYKVRHVTCLLIKNSENLWRHELQWNIAVVTFVSVVLSNEWHTH